jgi:hypothetical protein
MKNFYFCLWAALVALILLSGCMSLTTLQSAKTLDPGKVTVGLGAGLATDGKSGGPVAEAGMRAGVAKNFDFGAKWSYPLLLFFDGKYQVADGSLKVAADLGWSYFSYNGLIGNIHGTSYGWYPMLMIGQDHWYAAVKGVYFSTSGQFDFFGTQSFSDSRWISTNVVFGAVIGSKWQFMPEVNCIIPMYSGKTIIVPAVGLQIEL